MKWPFIIKFVEPEKFCTDINRWVVEEEFYNMYQMEIWGKTEMNSKFPYNVEIYIVKKNSWMVKFLILCHEMGHILMHLFGIRNYKWHIKYDNIMRKLKI